MTSLSEAPQLSLAHAQRCLQRAQTDPRGPWVRLVPLLLRQALEETITSRLASQQVDARASMRAKLLCLQSLAGEPMGTEATALWNALSHGCHYHAYRVEPTLDDVIDWAARTAAFVTQVQIPKIT